MRRIVNSFTFWALILSIVVIIMHQIGQDSKSIILIGLNPILELMSKSEACNKFMNSGMKVGCASIEGEISILWYIGAVITNLIYGVVLDLAKEICKKVYHSEEGVHRSEEKE